MTDMNGDWPDHLTPGEPPDQHPGDEQGHGSSQPYDSDLFNHVYGDPDLESGAPDTLHADSPDADSPDAASPDAHGIDVGRLGAEFDVDPGFADGQDFHEFDHRHSSAEEVPGFDTAAADVGVAAPIDEWANTIGPGAVDPTGTYASVLGGLEDPSATPYDEIVDDSGWTPDLADLDAANWTQPDLLAGVPGGTDSGGPEDDAGAGIQGLWERLAPGQVMPTTQVGSPDLGAALDRLAAGAGDRRLLDVIDAARRSMGT